MSPSFSGPSPGPSFFAAIAFATDRQTHLEIRLKTCTYSRVSSPPPAVGGVRVLVPSSCFPTLNTRPHFRRRHRRDRFSLRFWRCGTRISRRLRSLQVRTTDSSAASGAFSREPVRYISESPLSGLLHSSRNPPHRTVSPVAILNLG